MQVKFQTFLLAGILFFSTVSGVFAAPPTPNVTSNTTTVMPSLDVQFTQLKETYRTQLAKYRNDERQYTIAKEQYVQLQTLASLEEAVRATQQAMISRTVLLETYFKMLKLTLLQAKGIDLATKTAQVEALDKVLTALKTHQSQLQRATDKVALQQAEADFSIFVPEITAYQYRTLMLIAYGNMQAVYDKTVIVTQEISQKTEQEEKNALILAEKKRGFAEITRTLENLAALMKKTKEEELDQQKQAPSESDYNDVVEDLNEVYSGLSRSIDYLREILKK